MKKLLKLALCAVGLIAPTVIFAEDAKEDETPKTEYLIQVGYPKAEIPAEGSNSRVPAVNVTRYTLTRVEDTSTEYAKTKFLPSKLKLHLAIAKNNHDKWLEQLNKDLKEGADPIDPFPQDLGSYTRLGSDPGAIDQKGEYNITYSFYYDPVLDLGSAVDLEEHTAEKRFYIVIDKKNDDEKQTDMTESDFLSKVPMSAFGSTFRFRIKGDETGYYKITKSETIKAEDENSEDGGDEGGSGESGGEDSEGDEDGDDDGEDPETPKPLVEVVSTDAVIRTAEGVEAVKPFVLNWQDEKFSGQYYEKGSPKKPKFESAEHPEGSIIYYSPKYNYGLWEPDSPAGTEVVEYYLNQNFSYEIPVDPGKTPVSYAWFYLEGEDWRDSGWAYTKKLAFRTYAGDDKTGVRGRVTYSDGTVSYTKDLYYRLSSTIKVNKKPALENGYEGNNAKLTITATGSDLKFKWQYYNAEKKEWEDFTAESFGGKVENFDTNTCVIKGINAAEFAKLQVRCLVSSYGFEDPKEYVVGGTTTIALKQSAKITREPVSVTSTFGKTATLSLAATGTKLNYQWYKLNEKKTPVVKDPEMFGQLPTDDELQALGYSTDWKKLDGATKNSYVTPKIVDSSQHGGIFYCKVWSEGSVEELHVNSKIVQLGLTGISPDEGVFTGDIAEFVYYPTLAEPFLRWEVYDKTQKKWLTVKNKDGKEATELLHVVGGKCTSVPNGWKQTEYENLGEYPTLTMFRVAYQNKAGKEVYSKQVKLTVQDTDITMTGNLPAYTEHTGLIDVVDEGEGEGDGENQNPGDGDQPGGDEDDGDDEGGNTDDGNGDGEGNGNEPDPGTPSESEKEKIEVTYPVASNVFKAFEGEKLTLKVTAKGLAPLTYQWEKNSSSWVVVNYDDEGNEIVPDKDPDPKKPAIPVAYSVYKLNAGSTWSAIPGQTKNTLTINSLTAKDLNNLYYRCVIKNGAGKVVYTEPYGVTQRKTAAVTSFKIRSTQECACEQAGKECNCEKKKEGEEENTDPCECGEGCKCADDLVVNVGDQVRLIGLVSGDADVYARWEYQKPKAKAWTKLTGDLKVADGKIVYFETATADKIGARYRLVAWNDGNKKKPSESPAKSFGVKSEIVIIESLTGPKIVYEGKSIGYEYTVQATNANEFQWQVKYGNGQWQDIKGANESYLKFGYNGDSEGYGFPYKGEYTATGIGKYSIRCLVRNNYSDPPGIEDKDKEWVIPTTSVASTIYQEAKIKSISFTFTGAAPRTTEKSAEYHTGFNGYVPTLEVNTEGYVTKYNWFYSMDATAEGMVPERWIPFNVYTKKKMTPTLHQQLKDVVVSYKITIQNGGGSETYYITFDMEDPWMPLDLSGMNVVLVLSEEDNEAGNLRDQEKIEAFGLDKSKVLAYVYNERFALKKDEEGNNVIDPDVEPELLSDLEYYNPATYSYKRLGPSAASYTITLTNAANAKDKIQLTGKLYALNANHEAGRITGEMENTKVKPAERLGFGLEANSITAPGLVGRSLEVAETVDPGLSLGTDPLQVDWATDCTFDFTGPKTVNLFTPSGPLTGTYTYTKFGSNATLKVTANKFTVEYKLVYQDETSEPSWLGTGRVEVKDIKNKLTYKYIEFEVTETP